MSSNKSGVSQDEQSIRPQGDVPPPQGVFDIEGYVDELMLSSMLVAECVTTL